MQSKSIISNFKNLQRSSTRSSPPKLTGAFTAFKGGISVIIGESGVGKTTLLDFLSFTSKAFVADKKSLFYSNENREIQLKNAKSKGELAYLNRDAAFLPWKDVESNLRIVSSLSKRAHNLTQDEMDLRLQKLKLESSVLQKFPHELSFGMLRRLLILRCFLSGARFLFLDEVLVGLDPATKSEIAKFVADLCKNEEIISAVAVTHDPIPFLELPESNVTFFGIERGGKVSELPPTHSALTSFYRK